ncbi:MAG: lipid IV(A) 3-deoxy-D-manno-octulosonic acid transferase [Gammaproteobacteria bacterium]
MARIIYSLFFYLMLPFIIIRLLYKSRQSHGYRQRWRERFGWFQAPEKTGGIWIHAVSVGETIAAVPMIKALQQAYPYKQIIITSMTPTGSERVRALFHDSVFHVYVPYDFPGAVKRFLRKVKPSLLILMETELWPNCLHYCAKQKVPVILANARLSEQSYLGYRRIKRVAAKMLSEISLIGAQAEPDAQRFIKLGAAPDKVIVTGSMKFDIRIADSVQQHASELREALHPERPIWIAASTHENEEEHVLKAFQKIRQRVPDSLLILVPRHPERFPKVAELCRKQGYKVVCRSQHQFPNSHTDIYLGDTMGELLILYGASDIAFVGGSLVPIGGHNMLEPAALAIPSITGPNYFNFATIVSLLEEANGLRKIQNTDELADVVIDWFNDPSKRQQAGKNAKQVVEAHRGSMAAHLNMVEDILSPNRT